jgi:hypothetical protein
MNVRHNQYTRSQNILFKATKNGDDIGGSLGGCASTFV